MGKRGLYTVLVVRAKIDDRAVMVRRNVQKNCIMIFVAYLSDGWHDIKEYGKKMGSTGGHDKEVPNSMTVGEIFPDIEDDT